MPFDISPDATARVDEIIERDDGYIAASRFGPKIYFAPLRNWFKNERAAIRWQTA